MIEKEKLKKEGKGGFFSFFENFFLFLWEVFKVVLISLAIVLPIRLFLFQPFVVKGQSMEPTFHNGDYLIVDEITYKFRNPERGEVVVFYYPYYQGYYKKDVNLGSWHLFSIKIPHRQRFIKRIIGLPGETVEITDGKVFILESDGTKIQLKENYILSGKTKTYGGQELKVKLSKDEYFVMGDNRDFSFDSRVWGPVKKDFIIGRVVLRLFPLSKIEIFNLPQYSL